MPVFRKPHAPYYVHVSLYPLHWFLVAFMRKAYLRHRSQDVLELFLGRVRKIYTFDFGSELWVELLDTEGLELAMLFAGSCPFHIA